MCNRKIVKDKKPIARAMMVNWVGYSSSTCILCISGVMPRNRCTWSQSLELSFATFSVSFMSLRCNTGFEMALSAYAHHLPWYLLYSYPFHSVCIVSTSDSGFSFFHGGRCNFCSLPRRVPFANKSPGEWLLRPDLVTQSCFGPVHVWMKRIMDLVSH